MMVERLFSYWEGNFSGAMLNFGRVEPEIRQFSGGTSVPRCNYPEVACKALQLAQEAKKWPNIRKNGEFSFFFGVLRDMFLFLVNSGYKQRTSGFFLSFFFSGFKGHVVISGEFRV